MNINVILFPDFETLDVFGPVEVFGKVEKSTINYYSQQGGIISNKDGIRIETQKTDNIKINDVLFIPGGGGIRKEVGNIEFLNKIKSLAEKSRYILTVCTGSALLARTGLLDGKKATSNKRAFDWVKSNSDKVNWIQQARWVIDGKYYTSSGVSAGIDMALGFVSDCLGDEVAEQIAFRVEYNWQRDKLRDDFWKQ
ncbi:DJ-1/PfpI family protein [Dysgonomonas alginatilytica]|uniref:DJ-1/PfpI family protein n=1 Tax=Dysgonomonas alginatilytica TaxID=1605892 RepID=A0A2V3PIB6_9BACT|nr:DJ-1/PfpI family protein [Dysgonomonas alginatilytica]PXV58380.1 DJ-1/PfpI family protein [Dysgonomonas alginatilytica]